MVNGNLDSTSDNVFYIIAAGPSYLNVTEEEWKYLEGKNTITFALVPLSGRKTKYYFSIERFSIDENMLLYLKDLGHLDTKLLLYIPESQRLARDLGFKHIQRIQKKNFYFMPYKKPWFVDEPEPPCSFYETRATNFRQPLFRYRGQLTAVVNACILLGATEIRLIGVDLNTQWAFYDNVDFVKSKCNNKDTIKRFEKFFDWYTNFDVPRWAKYSPSIEEITMDEAGYETPVSGMRVENYEPDKQHSTNMVLYESKHDGKGQRGISDILEWMNKEMIKEGMKGIYVTDKNSLLYKEEKLEFKGITDE